MGKGYEQTLFNKRTLMQPTNLNKSDDWSLEKCESNQVEILSQAKQNDDH